MITGAEKEADLETRVLFVAPTARDAQITCDLLDRAGVLCVVCRTFSELAKLIPSGAGAVLMTDEAITGSEVEIILSVLATQPAWSDLPVVMMARGEVQSPAVSHLLRSLSNLTVLERPAPMRSIVSALQAAVRGRQRQYQIREQFQTIQEAQRQRQAVLDAERAALAEADRVGRMKDEFLATLSHELRTPLNAILGWAHLLQMAPMEPNDLKEGLATIERNARAQSELIDDLLDMSRIISGKMSMKFKDVEVAEVIEAAIATVRPAATAKGVELATAFQPDTGSIWGDSGRLQQIVWNLLSNAIKFTPAGGSIRVEIARRTLHLDITVTDSGQGIDPEFLPHVFERFRQADARTTREHGGLGLGLAIVKHLVELHGGSIVVSSRGKGTGTTFAIRLPITAVHDRALGDDLPAPKAMTARIQPHAVVKPANFTGIKILVVDDEPDARELLRRVLQETGASVVMASSASEALVSLHAEQPDVIVSDIGMPLVDGYELIRAVRALGTADGGKIPAIALTAFARAEDREQSARAGFDLHLSKPIEFSTLLTAVANFTGRSLTPRIS